MEAALEDQVHNLILHPYCIQLQMELYYYGTVTVKVPRTYNNCRNHVSSSFGREIADTYWESSAANFCILLFSFLRIKTNSNIFGVYDADDKRL